MAVVAAATLSNDPPPSRLAAVQPHGNQQTDATITPQPVSLQSATVATFFEPGALVRNPKHPQYGTGRLSHSSLSKEHKRYWQVDWAQGNHQRNVKYAESSLEPIIAEEPVLPPKPGQHVICLNGKHIGMQGTVTAVGSKMLFVQLDSNGPVIMMQPNRL